MYVRDYLASYLAERDVSADYPRDLRYTISYLDRWAGRPVDLSELADDLANRWLLHLSATMRPRSVKHHRTNLLALWRGAADAGLIDVWPRRVRRVKVPRTLVEAWHIDEMRRLLLAAEALTGKIRRWGIPRAALMRAYTLTGWNSGMRPYDLWLLEFAEVGSNGTLLHVAHKTGEVIMCPLWPETIAAIEAIAQPARQRIFGSVLGVSALRSQFKRLAKSAGLSGTPKKLRKSAATAVEAQKEGAASRFLGHRSPDLAAKHYVDRRHLNHVPILPPPLAG